MSFAAFVGDRVRWPFAAVSTTLVSMTMGISLPLVHNGLRKNSGREVLAADDEPNSYTATVAD